MSTLEGVWVGRAGSPSRKKSTKSLREDLHGSISRVYFALPAVSPGAA